MPKTDAEKKRINRANMRKVGYTQKQIWVKPSWWPELKAKRDELDKLNKEKT